ncbi:MAG: SDR family oxidoreductase [Flavobacterium sp.]
MKDKIIWITGASSGIGEALAHQFSKEHSLLILSSRNEAALLKVRSECAFPDRVKILPLDLEDLDSLPKKAATAWELYGSIDVLINNGGISQRSLALETNLSTEQKIMNIDFWGTTVLSKAVLPKMIANKGGQIVCVTSLVGKFGTKYRSAYSAAKHALHGYFDSLRSEIYSHNIYITMVCPGFIKTNVSINAMTADGSIQGTMDEAQSKGMSAGEFAQKMYKAISNKKEEVYIGGKEVYGVYLKRFFPKLFSKIVRKQKVT